MTTKPHDHDPRPDTADMRAALATTRAALNGADHGTTHQAAEGGTCPVCVAVAGISFGITMASTVAGDPMFVSEPVRLALLAMVDAAEQELGGASN